MTDTLSPLPGCPWVVEGVPKGAQGIVKPALHNGFGDVQVGGDLARRPSQVIRPVDELAMRSVQPSEGLADRRATEELLWVVGPGSVESLEPASLSFRSHDPDAAFMTKRPSSTARGPSRLRARHANRGERAAQSMGQDRRRPWADSPSDR